MTTLSQPDTAAAATVSAIRYLPPAPQAEAAHTTVATPLGTVLLVGVPAPDDPTGVALASLRFTDQPTPRAPGAPVPPGRRDDALFTEARDQLTAYLAGERPAFDLLFIDQGTPFQRRVWRALDAIPFGQTTSYQSLAANLGMPRGAARAVGSAVGANPLLLVRPCHRVIGATGALTGYAGGLDRKRQLLALEGALPQELPATTVRSAPAI